MSILERNAMTYPTCSVCGKAYNLAPDGVGGWTWKKPCYCLEPHPYRIEVIATDHAIPIRKPE